MIESGFGGPAGKVVIILTAPKNQTTKSSSEDILSFSNNIILTGGRNINNSNELFCKIGAVGSLCVLDLNYNSSMSLIDAKNIISNNPLLINENDLSQISIKIIQQAHVSYKMNLNTTILIIKNLELINSIFSDIRMSSIFLNNITFSIENNLTMSQNS